MWRADDPEAHDQADPQSRKNAKTAISEVVAKRLRLLIRFRNKNSAHNEEYRDAGKEAKSVPQNINNEFGGSETRKRMDDGSLQCGEQAHQVKIVDPPFVRGGTVADIHATIGGSWFPPSAREASQSTTAGHR
jgi:hypothetical protein